MSEKFQRRHFFKHFLKEIGETSTKTLRSFHLEDVVDEDDKEKAPQKPARTVSAEPLAVTTERPKRNT